MKSIWKTNRAAIITFFDKNPEGTRNDCCKKLGISYSTLVKHLKALKEGQMVS